MVKDKKYSIKDTMSIKISFMLYMKWSKGMLPEVLNCEEIKVVCKFLLFLFLFSMIFNW